MKVRRTTVPETPVDENADLFPMKNDIGLAPQVRLWTAISPKSQTNSPQRAAEEDFCRSIPLENSLHYAAHHR